MPAIHRGRAEIRDIFAREMPGVDPDLTDEPAVLAAAARTHLREVFLRARVAVSGANFGVAETGTLTVVESEGNGRMCLTLPDTLITVMGIEKVVPTWRDLEVFLQLLPRSSTGERMNPYTSTWTGVTARATDRQEFHLVLLDNGRTRALADELGRTALHCIRCSACLNVCPVYERTGGHAYGSVYPGPIGAVLTPLPHRRDRRRRPQRLAALRLQPVRRLLRRLPRQDQHPRPARRSCAPSTPRPTPTTHRLPTAEAAAMKAAAWVMADAKRFAQGGRAAAVGTARHTTREARPPPPTAAERVDRLARRPQPARPRRSATGGPAPEGHRS